jgi:hypothetical protein
MEFTQLIKYRKWRVIKNDIDSTHPVFYMEKLVLMQGIFLLQSWRL